MEVLKLSVNCWNFKSQLLSCRFKNEVVRMLTFFLGKKMEEGTTFNSLTNDQHERKIIFGAMTII